MKRLLPLLFTPSLTFAHDLPIWAAPLIPLTQPISALQKFKLNSAINSTRLIFLDQKPLLTPQGKPYALTLNYQLKLSKTFPAEHNVTPECQINHPQLSCHESHFSTINGQKLNPFNAEPRPAGVYIVRFLIYPRELSLNPQGQVECKDQDNLITKSSNEDLQDPLNTTQTPSQSAKQAELIFYYRLSNKPWSQQILRQHISSDINPSKWLYNTKSLTLKYCKNTI